MGLAAFRNFPLEKRREKWQKTLFLSPYSDNIPVLSKKSL